MMGTGTNSVPVNDPAIELLYFDNDGHWKEFGSRSDPALELLPYFDNDGYWN